MKRKSFKLFFVLVFLAALMGFFYFYQQKYPAHSVLVTQGNVDFRELFLSFRVPGRIEAIHFDEGDRVSSKMILAKLDTDTYLIDLARAKADYHLAEARLKAALLIYQRQEALIGSGAVSQAAFDDACSSKNQAEASLELAAANLDRAHLALADTELKAPSEGIISTRIHEPGAMVSQNEPIFSMALDTPIWVRIYVDEMDLDSLKLGQPALIYTDSKPEQPYHAHLSYISPEAEFTPKNVETTKIRTDLVYQARVTVDDRDHAGLHQGMPVTVRIQLAP